MITNATLEAAAKTLRLLAVNEKIKWYILRNATLHQTLLAAAKRYIGGETLDVCTQAARQLNQQGHLVTIDFMGESAHEISKTKEATYEFLNVVETINMQSLSSSISLDLSHIGLTVDLELGYRNCKKILEMARSCNIEVMISAEGIERTDIVLDTYHRLCKDYSNIGITLQAYLPRTFDDLEKIALHGGKVRIVKGAFAAGSQLILPRGPELDQVYRKLCNRAVDLGLQCSIGSHDLSLINLILQDLDNSENLEVEMLKGICEQKLNIVKRMGIVTRVYLPYGYEWYLYLCNRLAECPKGILTSIGEIYAVLEAQVN